MSAHQPEPSVYREPQSVDVLRLDISHLVGHEISLYSEQFPGKEIPARVTSAHDRLLVVDGSASAAVIDNLVHGQTVIARLEYKGQKVSVRAQLKRTVGGRCQLHLDEKVTPLSQRQYRRINLEASVRLAAFPATTFVRKNLPRLRWIETQIVNFSSGGALIVVPGILERDIFLLLSITLTTDLFPPLIIGQVRHCFAAENGRFHSGIEFFISEKFKSQAAPANVHELPSVVLSYSSRQREQLNKRIQAWTPTQGIRLEQGEV